MKILFANKFHYRRGGDCIHTNPVKFNGKTIVAIDYRIKNYNLVELFRKEKKRFKK